MMLSRRNLVFAGVLVCTGFAKAGSAQNAPTSLRFNNKQDLLSLGVLATETKLAGFHSLRLLRQNGRLSEHDFERMQFEGLDREDSQVFWTFFFRGATVFIGHSEGPQPIIGYYSATLDFWLLTLWGRGLSGAQIKAFKVVPGGALSPDNDEEVPAAPGFLRKLNKIGVLAQLKRTVAEADRQFSFQFPLPGVGTADSFYEIKEGADSKALLFSRTLFFIKNISALSREARSNGAYQALLSDCDTNRINDMSFYSAESAKSFAEIARAPATLVSNLSALAAFKVGDTWGVISGTPLYGRFEVLSVIAPSNRGGVIQRLALVDVNDDTRI